MTKGIRPSDADLKDVYEKLPEAFRAIRARSQQDINSRGMIFEGAYNQIVASRGKAFAALVLADAMAVLEESAAAGGWKLPERLLPLAEDCRRASVATAASEGDHG